jgi:hypothetical protein
MVCARIGMGRDIGALATGFALVRHDRVTGLRAAITVRD